MGPPLLVDNLYDALIIPAHGMSSLWCHKAPMVEGSCGVGKCASGNTKKTRVQFLARNSCGGVVLCVAVRGLADCLSVARLPAVSGEGVQSV